jgi:hypothetical protein
MERSEIRVSHARRTADPALHASYTAERNVTKHHFRKVVTGFREKMMQHQRR